MTDHDHDPPPSTPDPDPARSRPEGDPSADPVGPDPSVGHAAPVDPAAPAAPAGPAEHLEAAGGRFSRRSVLGAGILAVGGTLAMAAATAPRPARLGEPTGDEAITSALAEHLEGHRRVAIVLLDEGAEPRYAGFGAVETDEFEIGSVTKVFTGALLAAAISRGDVSLETTVGEVFEEQAEDSANADITLTELATHTAGLPSFPLSAAGSVLASTYLHRDPYRGWDEESLLSDALAAELTTRDEHVYSNMSVALEGLVLSRVGGASYAELVGSELIEPLGLSATYVPTDPADLRDTARRGHTVTGLPAAAWTMNAYAPAGCIRSTAADLATFLAATRDGSAPGAEAAQEVLVEQDETTGIAINWIHSRLSEDSTMIWHNGITGGYASFAGWETGSGRGLVLLTDTASPLDDVALEVLGGGIAL